ncbi:MAG: tetratricopeptide repeat protein [Chromatiales bacterium]
MKRVLPALVFCCAVAGVSAAQDDKPTVSQRTYDTLADAHALTTKGEYGKAAELLNALLPKLKGSAQEEALTYQMLGYVYSGANEYQQAAAAFRQALAGRSLPADEARTTTYNLAQILIHDEQYQEGLAYLEEWLTGERSPSREARALAAAGYYRSGDCETAIPHLRVLAAEVREGEEKWSQALLGCYIDMKRYDGVAAVLESLVRQDPANDENWLRLAAAYQQSDRHDKAIAVLELILQRGALTKDHIVSLARLYLSREVPYKAAQLLERKLGDGALDKSRENQTLLVDSLLLAQEREKAAAVIADMLKSTQEGELYYRLGRIHFDLRQWPEAMRALQSAFKTGGLEDPAAAHLLLGIAALHAQQITVAQQSLNQALRSKGTHDQAEWWLQRLQSQNIMSAQPPPG